LSNWQLFQKIQKLQILSHDRRVCLIGITDAKDSRIPASARRQRQGRRLYIRTWKRYKAKSTWILKIFLAG
jgi:hypothetical protein